MTPKLGGVAFFRDMSEVATDGWFTVRASVAVALFFGGAIVPSLQLTFHLLPERADPKLARREPGFSLTSCVFRLRPEHVLLISLAFLCGIADYVALM